MQNYSGWSYAGCYSDGSPRVYPNTLNPPNKTIESCLDTARTAGYSAAGIEYGGERDAGHATLPCAALVDVDADFALRVTQLA